MQAAWFEKLVRRFRPPQDPGGRGERAAAAALQAKGYRLVIRNWRHGRDELDLVCRDGEVLVFVEVKTRAAHAKVGGYAAVDRRKKRALRRACQAYLRQLAAPPPTFRLDVVEVVHRDGTPIDVRHYAHVPLFPSPFPGGRGGG